MSKVEVFWQLTMVLREETLPSHIVRYCFSFAKSLGRAIGTCPSRDYAQAQMQPSDLGSQV